MMKLRNAVIIASMLRSTSTRVVIKTDISQRYEGRKKWNKDGLLLTLLMPSHLLQQLSWKSDYDYFVAYTQDRVLPALTILHLNLFQMQHTKQQVYCLYQIPLVVVVVVVSCFVLHVVLCCCLLLFCRLLINIFSQYKYNKKAKNMA